MKNKLKNITSVVLILISISVFVPQKKVQAYVAWPDIGNAFFRTMLDEISIQIRAALVGAFKKAAINNMSETINELVSGESGDDSLFINDWEDYLSKTPEKDAKKYMNDFFSLTSRGRDSGSYTSSSSSSNTNSDSSSYSEWRSQMAKNLIEKPDYTELQDDYQEYADDVEGMFDDGTWAAYNAFMQPNNNPIAFSLITESLYLDKLEKEKTEAETKAQSYLGFKAKEGDDKNSVITPGSVIQGLTVAANTMDNDAIANARNIGEVAGIVVGKIASNVIKEGIGNARNNQDSDSSDTCDSSSADDNLQNELDDFTPDGNIRNNDSGLGSFGDSDSDKCSN